MTSVDAARDRSPLPVEAGKGVAGAVRWLVLAMLFFGAPAHAQTPAEFYKGKTINLITGTAGAGGYDLAARIVGEYLPRYMPGNPGTVIQPMPGASHVRATEYLMNISARDGLSLGFVQPYVALNKILNPSARYDPEKMTWLTRLLPLNQIGFSWHTSGVTNVEQARQKVLIMGAAGATGPAATVPWALNRMIGTKFRVVRDYADDTAEFLALERGELEGMGSANYGALVRRPGFVDKNWVQPLYAISTQRIAKLPNVPAIVELSNKPADLAVLNTLGAMPAIGLTVIAPPGIPAERVEALRRAFDAVVKDAGFIADMARAELEVEPMDGAALAAFVAKTMDVSAQTAQALRDYTAPQD